MFLIKTIFLLATIYLAPLSVLGGETFTSERWNNVDQKQKFESDWMKNRDEICLVDDNDNSVNHDFNATRNKNINNKITNDNTEHDSLEENKLQLEKITSKEEDSCKDSHELCPHWARMQECDKNPKYMLRNCHKSCNFCSKLQALHPYEREKTMKVIEESGLYYYNEVLEKSEYAKVRRHCQNRDAQCSYWAALGECEANPTYMTMHCALACKTCLKLDVAQRCPVDPSMEDSLKAEELHPMFENIVMNPDFAKYEPVIHSRPDDVSKDVEDKYFSDTSLNVTSKIGPWVVTLENFLSDEECDILIKYGHELGFLRSKDIGELKFDGSFTSSENNGRTSTNAWCDDNCMSNPLVAQVMSRMGQLTKTPVLNQESLQLLKYEVGQFYQRHHDFTDMHIDRQQGPRILTFFLYLNDVEDGGGTKFNDLDIVVKPKKGKALIWPSVLNRNINEKDFRTHHEAMAVKKGLKYGANVWIHLRDYQTPMRKGCS